MAIVLVTGGTGRLGKRLVPLLFGAGHEVRVLSRRARRDLPAGATAFQGDLATGEGLAEAVSGAEVIVHAASDPRGATEATDVQSTACLVEAAQAAGVGHLLYVSIVGVDRIPTPYYDAKRRAELLVEDSGLPWTVLRATQFHDLMESTVRQAIRSSLVVLPRGFRFQPIATMDAAQRIVDLLGQRPAKGIVNVGGPDVWSFTDLVRTYAGVAGLRLLTLSLPGPWRLPPPFRVNGGAAKAFRTGANLVPDDRYGTVTWMDHLRLQLAAVHGTATSV